MELNEDNFKLIAQYLQQTLSPDANIRRPAEKFLENVETNQNYSILLLHLVGKDDVDSTIRIASSIAFKNFVRRNWNAHADSDSPDRIHSDDRSAIKQYIVSLMLKSSPSIQKQLSDAISIIGKYDFPDKWPQLINEMVEKFATGDFNVINGVLQTAHSIFKRYRYEFKSQKLWEEILLVLNTFAKPLTDLLVATMELAKTQQDNVTALKVTYSSLDLMAKVFYSLNSQDLPEFFEDHMVIWMNAFHVLLVTDVPCLKTGDDEEAGVTEQLRSQICDNLGLYALKYDEEFGTYMQQFVTDVWELLVKTGIQTKYDSIVSNALKFLSIVADRSHYRNLFEDPTVLASICEKVVIPNMDFRTSDEEIFEDSPEEYIRRDIEGSDTETRRRAACDLVKCLSQNFEAKIFEIFSQYLQVLLGKYAENPVQNWRTKDTAIYLVTSLASRGGTQKLGVTQTSELVPLPQFCQQQIVPELERADVNELPVIKADALKFIMTFRSVLGPQTMLACMPLLIRHLNATSIVVHSYAACGIEKILLLKGPNGSPLITKEQLSPMSAELLNGLFAILSKPGSTENEFVMKAIMRSFSTLEEVSLPFMGAALPRLTEILTIVSKNPSRPNFNHFLFETLSLATRIVCKAQPSAVSSFEEALFPVFQDILQQDVLEFMPYVFQILSLLLEMREEVKTAIPEPYWALFPCLLSPALWDRTGNVTPLIRLLSAFIRRGSNQIKQLDKLNAILGVFQKMIASKANDHEGFNLMQVLLTHYPFNELEPSIRQVFALLFQRLSLSKTAKYVKGLIVFLCFYAAKVGSAPLVELIDNIQPQMFGMVIERVLILDLAKVSGETSKKIVSIGIAKILCECPALLINPYRAYWPKLLESLIQIYELPPDMGPLDGDHFNDTEDVEYQAAYSQLNFAQSKTYDPLCDVTDGRKFLIQNLAILSLSRPGEIPTLIASLQSDHQQALQKYCAQYGIQIA
ncbi:Exportin-2 [Pseudolycoriella hygida]|uniref:Exportin-2 n=1 Tax=Pseudolycoriella hygida TaxID=35572 RepID=A0A9Q0NCH8_9DIPT|nr:Exportin-2 [Pseudolycoriella hygida]